MKANADCFADDLAPVAADIRASGQVSLWAIAAKINIGGKSPKHRNNWLEMV